METSESILLRLWKPLNLNYHSHENLESKLLRLWEPLNLNL